MLDVDWLAEAISNNAAWCDAIASSHNVPTSWNESYWMSKHPMPRFYPNIITLKSDTAIDNQIDIIKPQLPSGWGIKDSFAELDLHSNGFSPAFDAHWYCRVPTNGIIDNFKRQHHVHTVKTQLELNRWASAWGDGTDIFNAALLEKQCVELLYIEHHNNIVAGLAINLSGHSVGISNAFGSPNELLSSVASVIEKNPDKGLVGYGDQTEMALLSKIGFRNIGDMRVWER